jgi:folate-dependent phosphoribosylglycinamide formyltransferase PurN
MVMGMNTLKPRLLIFASGTKTVGGSGFKNLVEASRTDILDAEIIGVVSNHPNGGVHKHATELDIPFILFPQNGEQATYQKIVEEAKPDFIALSGWLKLVSGLDPETTFNIHPGPLPAFGGNGLYGHRVHEAVIEAYKRGGITNSAISMHFVTEQYDEGPVFFSHEVKILPNDTPDTLATRVNEAEHKWQPIITNKIVHRKIGWDGKDPKSLVTN